jgi:hypothetical protein
MAKMLKEVMDLFNDREASKVLETIDAAGSLNVAPKGSLAAIDQETIAYAEVAGGKPEANLEAIKKVVAAAFKTQMPPVGYQAKGPSRDSRPQGLYFTGLPSC